MIPRPNKLAVGAGYTVVHGRMLSSTEWANARRADATKPAGQVTPSPKPFSPEGMPLKLVEPSGWKPEIAAVTACTEQVGRLRLGRAVTVTIADDAGWSYSAAYGAGRLTLNLARLINAWFVPGSEEADALLLHELAHEYSGNHLSSENHRSICRLAPNPIGHVVTGCGGTVTHYPLRQHELNQIGHVRSNS